LIVLLHRCLDLNGGVDFWGTAVVLLFHPSLRFMNLELFLVMLLIPCALVIGVLSFLILKFKQFSSESFVQEILPPAGFLWSTLPLFSPKLRRWGLCSLIREWHSHVVTVESIGLCTLCIAGLLGPAEYHIATYWRS
jgi:hypothetical protein